jgi:LmbE family N-acetylglucosaminyl deacetylase
MQILVSGAHPDDIELGAACLVQRMISGGHEVHLLILTDEAGEGSERREETVRAAKVLNVPRSRVHFAGFDDGSLVANRASVARLRELAAERGLRPAVVVTHTAADSHNDHSQANALVRATFRGCVMLFYSIHISAETAYFAPRFFVSVHGAEASRKEMALREHRSQRERLSKRDLCDYETALGTAARLDRAEAFEVELQVGAQADLGEVLSINDSPFHRFWSPMIRGEELYLLYEAYGRRPASIELYSQHHESAGRDFLRESFQRHWFPTPPLRERFSNSPNAQEIMENHHVLLVGGASSNPITRSLFNPLSTVDWVVEHDTSGTEQVYLLRKSTGQRIFAEDRSAAGDLLSDLGVLTVMRNPWHPGRWIVGCSAVHGVGTQGLLHFLADPASNLALLGQIGQRELAQIPVRIRVPDLTLELL